MESKKKENFLLYHNLFPMIEELNDEDVGNVIKSIFRYSINGEIPKYEKASVKSMLFIAIKNSIDINNEKYVEKCQKSRESILKRWQKIFYNNEQYNREQFEKYSKENYIDETFEDILVNQKKYFDNNEIDTIKTRYNCKLVSDETINKNFS